MHQTRELGAQSYTQNSNTKLAHKTQTHTPRICAHMFVHSSADWMINASFASFGCILFLKCSSCLDFGTSHRIKHAALRIHKQYDSYGDRIVTFYMPPNLRTCDRQQHGSQPACRICWWWRHWQHDNCQHSNTELTNRIDATENSVRVSRFPIPRAIKLGAQMCDHTHTLMSVYICRHTSQSVCLPVSKNYDTHIDWYKYYTCVCVFLYRIDARAEANANFPNHALTHTDEPVESCLRTNWPTKHTERVSSTDWMKPGRRKTHHPSVFCRECSVWRAFLVATYDAWCSREFASCASCGWGCAQYVEFLQTTCVNSELHLCSGKRLHIDAFYDFETTLKLRNETPYRNIDHWRILYRIYNPACSAENRKVVCLR